MELGYDTREIEMLDSLTRLNGTYSTDDIKILRKEKIMRLDRIREIKDILVQLNEPTITDRDPEAILKEILAEIEGLECIDPSGGKIDILTLSDRTNLMIKRGSLNNEERSEIESHVIETYKFVSKIPWPPEYRRIPEIALRHHEKLDGTGYPDKLKGRDATSLQSRMMSIADIFDALVAQDRPYKKSVPIDRVISILQEEAGANKLDPDLVNLFIDKKIYIKFISPEQREQILN